MGRAKEAPEGVLVPLWRFLYAPSSTPYAFMWMIVMMAVTIGSVVATVACSIPPEYVNRSNWELADSIFNWIYTGELFLIVVAYIKNPKLMMYDWIIYCEFLTLIPFWIDEAVRHNAEDDRPLGPMESFRMLRLLQLARYYDGIELVLGSVRRSFFALLVPLCYLFIAGLFFAQLIFEVERKENPDINSIPQAYYFIIITMTTVGYGDVSPVTPLGKAIGCCVVLFGIVFLALPLAVVGQEFLDSWEAKSLERISRRVGLAMEEKSMSNTEFVQQLTSKSQDGILIDKSALEEFMIQIGVSLTPRQLSKLIEYLKSGSCEPVKVAHLAETLLQGCPDYFAVVGGRKKEKQGKHYVLMLDEKENGGGETRNGSSSVYDKFPNKGYSKEVTGKLNSLLEAQVRFEVALKDMKRLTSALSQEIAAAGTK